MRKGVWEVALISLTVTVSLYAVIKPLHRMIGSYHYSTETCNTVQPKECKCTNNSDGSNKVRSFVSPGLSTYNSTLYTNTYTRLGSELNFNTKTCPPQSLALHNFTGTNKPLQSSCPAVFIIGARKGGTTSLYQYLSHHPNFEGIHLEEGPGAGETYHFSARYTLENWKTYSSRFPKLKVMTGDASVGNLVNCQVPARIIETCGSVSKILVLLRNPIKRYLSNFFMRTNLHTKEYSPNTALSTIINLEMDSFYNKLLHNGLDVSLNPDKWEQYRCMYNPSDNMLYEGLYYVHLMNWLCNYPRNNILVMKSEEFYQNTSVIMEQVYNFLGLSPLSKESRKLVTSFIFNKGNKTRLLPHQVLLKNEEKKLRHLYKPFNEALAHLLQWNDLSW